MSDRLKANISTRPWASLDADDHHDYDCDDDDDGDQYDAVGHDRCGKESKHCSLSTHLNSSEHCLMTPGIAFSVLGNILTIFVKVEFLPMRVNLWQKLHFSDFDIPAKK